jgi:ferrous iron transport protein A
MAKTLAEFSVGTKGLVVGFTKGSTQYRQKLMAMGLVGGTEFEITRVAPLGDPVEIKVRNFNLSLRRDEANSLKVEENGQ